LVVGFRRLKGNLLENSMQAITSHSPPGEIGEGPLLRPEIRSGEAALFSSGIGVSTLFMHDRVNRS
jgi:hypothetical protein